MGGRPVSWAKSLPCGLPLAGAVTPQDDRWRFDCVGFIAKYGGTLSTYADRQTIYAQGDMAGALFYVVRGAVKVTFLSEHGREAVIGVRMADEFFGENCVDGQLLRGSTIVAAGECEIARFDRAIVDHALGADAAFARLLMHVILDRNRKLRADLIDRQFNSSEKRLARILLTLANHPPGAEASVITMAVSQEMLASMVGTTRSRINQFMNKFRKLGYIDYSGRITVRSSLLNAVLLPDANTDGT